MLLMGGCLLSAIKVCIVLNYSKQCMLCAVVLTLFCCSFLMFYFARFCLDMAILVKTSQNRLLCKKVSVSFSVHLESYLQDMLQRDRYCK